MSGIVDDTLVDQYISDSLERSIALAQSMTDEQLAEWSARVNERIANNPNLQFLNQFFKD